MAEDKTKKDEVVSEQPKEADDQAVKINKPTEVPPINAENSDVKTEMPVAEQPLVVSEADVKQAATGTEPVIAAINDEIEVLTGEIQALESKIDRLSGSVETPTPQKVESAPIEKAPEPTKPAEEVKPQVEPIAPPPAPLVENKPEIEKVEPKVEAKPEVKPTETNKPSEITKGVNDIYQKITNEQKKAEEDQKEEDVIDAKSGFVDILGTVSDIISVFGVIVFLGMMLMPFYKSYLSESIVEATKSIGWLSAGGCLAAALLLSLPVKGKWATKAMLLVFLLLVALMWLGINNNSLLSAVEPYLGTLFGHYR